MIRRPPSSPLFPYTPLFQSPRLHIEFMQILADVINDLAGAARPVEVKLYGERLDTLEAYARRLAPELERIRGLEDLYNGDRKSTRLNSSHLVISYAVFCLKK